MKKIFTSLVLILLFILLFFCSIKNYTNAVSNDLADCFFRLHILANSDSEEDQNLKLKVRDKILEYMNNQEFTSKEVAKEFVNNNIEDLYKIAEDTIKENGYDYSVNIEIGELYFPTKNYGNVSLPAGMYDGIKIQIGDANGQNWWCSLFPPLCFVDISSGVIDDSDLDDLENELTSQEFKLITNSENETIKFKFKLLELINSKK